MVCEGGGLDMKRIKKKTRKNRNKQIKKKIRKNRKKQYQRGEPLKCSFGEDMFGYIFEADNDEEARAIFKKLAMRDGHVNAEPKIMERLGQLGEGGLDKLRVVLREKGYSSLSKAA
jgi:hypothetical protein